MCVASLGEILYLDCLLVASALFMLYLGIHQALLYPVSTNKVSESTHSKHENTGAGHIQTAIFHSNFSQIHFPVFKIFVDFIFTSNCHDGVIVTSPQQTSS
jgi:hypothetical protein